MAASSILVGLLLSSKTITDPSLNAVNRDTRATTQVPWNLDLQNLFTDPSLNAVNRDTRATTQVPWNLDLQNLFTDPRLNRDIRTTTPVPWHLELQNLLSDSNSNRGKKATTQVPWHLDLQNLINHCPGDHCDDTPIGLQPGSFQNNGKECPGGRCRITPDNVLKGSSHIRNKDCRGTRCDVNLINILPKSINNRNQGCKGKHCNVNPISLLQRRFQNKDKGCLGGWCDITSNSPILGTFLNLDRCPGGRCEVTTEGPTLGGFQGTADPFEDYYVTENTLAYESDPRVTDPIKFSETDSFSTSNINENIQNSFPNSIVANFAPTVGEVPTSANIATPGNVVTVSSTSSIAPSRGFVYVDFGEAQNGYDGRGSIKVVSQEIDNSRLQRQSSIVDNDHDFWSSINGILGGELGFPKHQINNQHSNNNRNQHSARKFNSNNVAVPNKGTREGRSFTSFPGESVRSPSRGFITVDFGGDPDDWGPGGFIRVVSHE